MGTIIFQGKVVSFLNEGNKESCWIWDPLKHWGFSKLHGIRTQKTIFQHENLLKSIKTTYTDCPRVFRIELKTKINFCYLCFFFKLLGGGGGTCSRHNRPCMLLTVVSNWHVTNSLRLKNACISTCTHWSTEGLRFNFLKYQCRQWLWS
jgi:hypothetical protein